MKQDSTHLTPAATKALITFITVVAVCLALTIYLGLTAPAEKGVADYFAHGVFSTLCALPAGAAWRAFSKALKGRP